MTSIKHLLIDLDNTLYINDEVAEFMVKQVEQYIVEYLQVDEIDAPRLNQKLHKEYGTTLAGLVAEGYDVNILLYQQKIHDLDYEKLILPDPELKSLLMQIRQPKYIFTNGNMTHAIRCLEQMEMTDTFQGVLCYESVQDIARKSGYNLDQRIVCKPHQDAFTLVLNEIGGEASSTLFIDDSLQNIFGAQELNIQTLHINQNSHTVNGIQRASSLMELPRFYPQLFTSHVENNLFCNGKQ